MKRSYRRFLLDLGCSLLVLSGATALGFLFDRWGFTNSNIMLLYQLGVLLIAIFTAHRSYSLLSAIASVFLFNYFFIQPKFTLNAYEAGYPVTFVDMFLTAFLSSSLAIQLKKSAKEKEEAAVLIENERLRSAILRTISHDLRTPLTAISGNASNLLSSEESFDTQTRRQLYADIYEDALWLTDLVENLLASTKLENGTESLRGAGGRDPQRGAAACTPGGPQPDDRAYAHGGAAAGKGRRTADRAGGHKPGQQRHPVYPRRFPHPDLRPPGRGQGLHLRSR